MSASYSTTRAPSDKPAKPYPDFPLFPHAAGVWAKKIRGKLHYFGPWGDPDAALAKYLEQKDALHAGLKPQGDAEGFTVKELCNQFLNAKAASRDAGELTARSWQDYRDACDLIVKHFGKGRLLDDIGPDDFAELRKKMAKRWGPGTLGNVINRMRVAFKFASDNGLSARPVRYGQNFKRPSRKTLRIDKAKKGPKLFTAEEIRQLMNAAGVQVKAMILLGISASLHAACSVPLFLIHEFYPDNMGFNPKGMVQMPYQVDKEGYVTLPPGPGLGVAVDEKAVAEAALKPQTYRWPGAKLKDGSIADY